LKATTGEDLTLTAGMGDIHFANTVGAGGALGALLIINSFDVTADNTINAASLVQSAGSGTSTFDGAVTTTGTTAASGKIDVTADTIVVNALLDTTAGGSVSLDADTNTLTMSLNGDITSAAEVVLSGSGGILTAGNITTAGTAITFNDATTLTGNVLLDTTAGPGTMTFNDTLDGTFDLGLTAGTGDIAFNDAVGSNDPLGVLTIFSAHDVTAASTINAASFTQIAGSGTTTFNGEITTTTPAGVSVTANNVNLDDITASSLSVNAGLDINQNLATSLNITNNASFNSTAGLIDLTNSGNNFGTLNLTGTKTIDVAESSDTVLAGVTAGDLTSTLTVTSTGAISDTGPVISNNTIFNSGGAITMNDVLNDFGTLSVTSSGNAVILVDKDDITLGNFASGVFSLNVQSQGPILQQNGSTIVVAGPSVLDTGIGSTITLDETSNDFSTVSITSLADTVTLADTNAIELAGLASSSLVVDAGSHITQSGNISVSGATTLTTTASSDITINTGTVNFNTLNVTGRTVAIDEDSATILSGANATTLNITSAGTITDNEFAPLVAVNANFNGSGLVTLNNPVNDFGTVSITSTGNDVTLFDINNLVLGSLDSASLNVKTIGSITEQAAATIKVAGQTSLDTGNSKVITLTESTNDFNTFSVNSTNDTVSVVDVNGIVIGAMSALSLDVTAGGPITQSGIFTISGNATFDAGASNLVLNNNDNDFNTLNITQAADATVTDVNGLVLQGATTGGNLHVTVDTNNDASDTLSVTGTLTVGGDTTLLGSAIASEIIDINADIVSTGALLIQNASTVDLATNVDLTGSSVSILNNIGSIILSDISGSSTNAITATAPGVLGTIGLDNILSNFSQLSLNSQGTTNVAEYTGGNNRL
jgi:hypothetical protein